MEYRAVYKCRLCGKVYRNGATAGEGIAEACLVELHTRTCGTVPMAPRMTETHRCGGGRVGSLGLADFQGWAVMPPDIDDRTCSGLLEED